MHNGESNKWVAIRRMNHKPWDKPLKLEYGYKSLVHAQEAVHYPISFTATEIEWFLYHGIETFCKFYKKQVM